MCNPGGGGAALDPLGAFLYNLLHTSCCRTRKALRCEVDAVMFERIQCESRQRFVDVRVEKATTSNGSTLTSVSKQHNGLEKFLCIVRSLSAAHKGRKCQQLSISHCVFFSPSLTFSSLHLSSYFPLDISCCSVSLLTARWR